MKGVNADKSSPLETGRFNPSAVLSLTFCLVGVGLAIFCFAESPPTSTPSASVEQVHGLYRGMPVSYVVKDGKAIFQGDIILEPATIDSVSVAYSKYLWPKVGNQYQIPYTIASGSGNLANLNT